jgi:hypothetical protein
MRAWTVLGILMAFCIGVAMPVLSEDWREQSGRGRWWHGDYRALRVCTSDALMRLWVRGGQSEDSPDLSFYAE